MSSCFNPKELALAQRLAEYSFMIPQDPDLIKSCYDSNAVIITNNVNYSLNEFVEVLRQSNTLNVINICELDTRYTPCGENKIAWTVKVVQERLGNGLNEKGEGVYEINQRAVLSFSKGLIIRQENTLDKKLIGFFSLGKY